MKNRILKSLLVSSLVFGAFVAGGNAMDTKNESSNGNFVVLEKTLDSLKTASSLLKEKTLLESEHPGFIACFLELVRQANEADTEKQKEYEETMECMTEVGRQLKEAYGLKEELDKERNNVTNEIKELEKGSSNQAQGKQLVAKQEKLGQVNKQIREMSPELRQKRVEGRYYERKTARLLWDLLSLRKETEKLQNIIDKLNKEKLSGADAQKIKDDLLNIVCSKKCDAFSEVFVVENSIDGLNKQKQFWEGVKKSEEKNQPEPNLKWLEEMESQLAIVNFELSKTDKEENMRKLKKLREQVSTLDNAVQKMVTNPPRRMVRKGA